MTRGIARLAIITTMGLCVACSDGTTTPDSLIPHDAGLEWVAMEGGTDSQVELGPDGPPPTCQLLLSTINGTAVASKTDISSADDKDSTKTGIQVQVVVAVNGAPDGTTVTLSVTGQTPSTAKSSGNLATFNGVTISSTLSVVTFKAQATGCSSDSLALPVSSDPACIFVQPTTGKLTNKDNEDTTGSGTFLYTIIVQTMNAAGGTVALDINSKPAQPTSSAAVGSYGTVSFKKTQLASGSNNIKATVTVGSLTASCTPTTNPISVDISTPTCDCCTFTPAAKNITSKNKWGLGPAQDADSNTANGVQTTITVTTDSTVDQVTLDRGDGSAKLLATPSGGVATFSNVTIKEGDLTLDATCNDTVNKRTATSKFNLVVDITKPNAVADLACTVTHNRKGEITCTWTSVADQNASTASGIYQYLLHYLKNTAISDTNFDSSGVTKLTEPAAASGSSQSKKVSSLLLANTYYYAIKAEDNLGNISAISNLPAGAKVDFKMQEIGAPTTGGQFGAKIAVGDFNCDGNSDLAVGEPMGNSKLGKVYLYFGSGAGFLSTPSSVIEGTLTDNQLGYGLTSLQFDGDAGKCDDLAVTAYGADTGRGRVYLYLGHTGLWPQRNDVTAGKGAEIYYTLDTSTAGATERLGWGTAGADLDADGKSDLLIGHFLLGSGGFATVLGIYGQSGIPLMGGTTVPTQVILPGKADLVVKGGLSTDAFGWIITTGGRLDSDAYHDVLISSFLASGSQGALYLLKGAAKSSGQETIDITVASSRIIKISGSSITKMFGSVTAGLGDLNNDGTPEFAVADVNYDPGSAANTGRIYVFSLGSTTPSSVSDAVALIDNDYTSSKDNYFGRGLANGAVIDPVKGADINKDGYADLVCSSKLTGSGNYGSLFMFFGQTGTLTNRKVSTADYVYSGISGDTSLGLTTNFLLDINADGYVDLVAGEPYYQSNKGRIWVFY